MSLRFSRIFKATPPWFRGASEPGDVVVGAMGRMVRNLRGYSFPGWSTEESRRETASLLISTLQQERGMKTAFCEEMTSLSLQERRILLERKLISPCLAARQSGCYVLLSNKQDVAHLINEEEHLVSLVFQSGFIPDKILRTLEGLAHRLEKELPIARDHRFGYLSSIPAECGGGVQLYLLLHLPALSLSGAIPQVMRGVEKLQLGFSPLYAELPDDAGNLFVLSTPPCPQGNLLHILKQLVTVSGTLMKREFQMRAQCVQQRPLELADHVGRAYGLLQHARRLSFRELVDMLSMLRLGIQCHLLRSEEDEASLYRRLLPLYVEASPAHLLHHFGEDAIDHSAAIRSQLVRERLSALCLPEDDFSPLHSHS